MEIRVKESSMICPAGDTPRQRLWISNSDMVMANYHIPLVFFYKPNPNGGCWDFLESRLREALSKTLVPFYPMAGRLGSDENGRLQIVCNAEGVLWVEAQANCALHDLGPHFVPSPQLRQLVPTLDDTSSNSADTSLIMIQHNFIDGTATFYFLNSWADTARGSPRIQMPVPPHIDRTLLRARMPPTPRFHHPEYDPPPPLISNSHPSPNPISVRVFKLSLDQLNTLKAKAKSFQNENENSTKYSTFTILAAYIWRCACKARGLLDDQPTMLYMTTNGRPRLHPPLPSTYLGNAIFNATSKALSGNLQSEPFVNSLERIHGALERMDDEYLRSAIDYLETLPDITAVRRDALTFRCPNLCIINWMRLPLHDVNFGWGRPMYMGPANVTHEGKIYLVSSPTDDGSLSLVACLQTCYMEPFQKHLYGGLTPVVDKIKARY